MNHTLIIIAVACVLLFVLAIVIVIFLNSSKDHKVVSVAASKSLNVGQMTLEQMLAKLSDPHLSIKDLHDLALHFINTQKLPSKSNSLSPDAKHKLDFVTLFALHPNNNAKEITFLNKELIKHYPSYEREIDAYEQMGLAKRKMRQI